MTRLLRPAALLGAAVLLVAGCGGADDEPAGTAPATTGSRTETQPGAVTETGDGSGTDGIDPMDGASTDPVTVPATNIETALLTGVRAARHEGYDRVVFEFRNVVPGYDVRYVEKPIHEDASGRVVPVDGAYVAQVRMQNALDADLTQEAAPPSYTGPQRLRPGTPEVVELVRTGGFEAVLTWVVGLNDRVDFRVLTLHGPPRLVIDFRNH